MKSRTMLGMIFVGAAVYSILLGAGAASATILSVKGATKNESVSITATLASGSSATLRASDSSLIETCTSSEFQGKTEGSFSGPTVGGALSSLTYSGCTHPTKVFALGKFSIESISGTTNGTLSSSGTERTLYSTAFGTSAFCKTGGGTDLGTLTGLNEGHATIDVDAKLSCGIYGTVTWSATYKVTTPTGLAVEKEAPPVETGTELYRNTGSGIFDTLGAGTPIVATLKTGTSMLLKDSAGTSTDTCTGSEVKGTIESAGGETVHPSGKLTGLTFTGCSHTTTVIAKGELEVKSIAGSTNGTVYSKGAEVTVASTAFGASAVCKTGTGTAIGVLTGAGAGEQAVIDVNGKIPCGILGNSTLTGTYLVTNPTGLVVEDGKEQVKETGTELYRNTGSGILDTLGTGTEITATVQPATSLILKDSFGTTTDTCTGSEIKGKIESAGGETSHPSGKLSGLTFTGCSHTTTVIAKGELEVKSIAGSTNGTVYSKNAEVTVSSTAFGASAVCKTGTGTALGILTGAGAGEQAVIDINATIPCGILGNSKLTGSYLVTNPTGLVVEAQ